MHPAFLAFATFAPAAPAVPAPVPEPPAAPTLVEPDASLLAPFLEDAAEKPKDVWSGSISAAGTYQSGNTNKRAASMNALAERRGDNDRWTWKAYWDYSENKTDGDWVLDTRKAGTSLKYDYFLSKKVYVNGVGAVETDTFADLELRWYVGPGVGYQWREDEKIKWGSEAGVMYFSDNHKVDEDEEYIAARLANNFVWQITKDTAFEHYFEVFPSLEDKDDVYFKSDMRLKTSLVAAMFAQLQWVWDYDNTPADTKERNDHKVLLGLGWSF